MQPAIIGFTWTLWRQQRIGLFIVIGYLLFAAAASAVLPAHFSSEVAHNVCGFVLSLMLPIIAAYLLGAFTYATDSGDLVARASCFPPRLFRLPVPTLALVGWPVLGGAATVMTLWIATAWFILRPWLARFDEAVPLWWPALFTTATLAWLQTLLWTPFGLRGVRVAFLIALAGAVTALGVSSAQTNISESRFVVLYGGLTLIGWAASYAVVRNARHGYVPDWDALLAPLRRFARTRPHAVMPFASAHRAETWLEWHMSGFTLPIMTALVLPTMIALLALGRDEPFLIARTLLSALAVPVLFAGIAGISTTGKNRGVKDHFGIPPFIACLPMSTADLVGTKLKTAALSTLATWMLLAVVLTAAIACTGNLATVAGWWQLALQERHPAQVVAGLAATLTLLFTWTWKRKVDSLYIGLSGREWLAATVFVAAFFGVVGGWMLAVWVVLHPEMYKTTGLSGRPVLGAVLFIASVFGSIGLLVLIWWICVHPGTHALALAVLPWLLGTLMLCRLAAAAWALHKVLGRGLVRPATVARWMAAWLLLATTLFGALAWAVPAERVPIHYILFAVLFALPMARLAGAPLALAWNRHR